MGILIVFIFVEFLSSYLLLAHRIQNIRSAPQNAWLTSYYCRPYTMSVASRRWVWFDISSVFTDFSNSGVKYLAFCFKTG
jgi:hypothetical protein